MIEKNFNSENYLPVFLSDNFFVFPSCTEFLNLENNKNLKKILVDSWKKHNGKFLIVSSKFTLDKEELDNYDPEKFFRYGSLVKIENDFSKDANIEVVFDSLREIKIIGVDRVKLLDFRKEEEEFYCSKYLIFRDESSSSLSNNLQKTKVVNETVKKLTILLSSLLQKTNSPAPYLVFSSSEDISNIVDFFIQKNKSLSRAFKQSMLEEYRLESRIKILTDLDREMRKADRDIKEKINEKIINQQTSAYLREQLSSIQSQINEIEGNKSEKDLILKRIESEPFPNYVKETVRSELDNYEKIVPYSPEASMVRGYIDWILNLPWYRTESEKSTSLDIKFVRKSLDKDHHGLVKVKEKITEYFAVLQNLNNKEKLAKKENE